MEKRDRDEWWAKLTRRNFDDSSGMPIVEAVATRRLDEDGGITETFNEDLAWYVKQIETTTCAEHQKLFRNTGTEPTGSNCCVAQNDLMKGVSGWCSQTNATSIDTGYCRPLQSYEHLDAQKRTYTRFYKLLESKHLDLTISVMTTTWNEIDFVVANYGYYINSFYKIMTP